MLVDIQAKALENTLDYPVGKLKEYLLKFDYGRYEESGVTDALREYWHDWVASGGPIRPNQDLFP